MVNKAAPRPKEPDRFESKTAEVTTQISLGAGDYITMKTKAKQLRIKVGGGDETVIDLPLEIFDDAGRPIARIEKSK